MALSAAVAVGGLPTSGSASFTVSEFGEPTAAIIIAGRQSLEASGDQSAASAVAGVGFWDGTNQVAVAIRSLDSTGSGTTNREQNDGYGAIYYQSTSAYFTVSATTDGVSIALSSGTISAEIAATVILLKGTTNAAAAAYGLGTSTGNQAIDLGWRANCVLAATVGAGGGDSSNTHVILSFGAATIADNGTVVQRMICVDDENAGDPTDTGSYSASGYIGGQIFNGSASWLVEVEADDDGFIFDTNASTNSDYIYYLALQLPNAEDVFLAGYTTPTSGTLPLSESQTGTGFTPQALLAFGTLATTENSITNGAAAFFGATDGTRSRALGVCMKHDADPTDTESYKTDDFIAVNDDEGNALANATIDSLDSDGWTVDWDTINATARYYRVLAFGDSTAGGGVTLTVSALTASAALDAVALAQAHTLAVADAAASASLDGVALTQAYVLVAADCTAAAALDAVTLSQSVSLTTADLAAAASLDAVALTQAYQLIVADLAAAAALDGLTLSTGLALAPADLSAAAALDSVALTQANTLAVVDLASGATLDSVTLSESVAVTVADLAAAAALDGVVLSTATVLAPADLSAGATIDGVALTQAHVLVVSDLLAAALLDAVQFPSGFKAAGKIIRVQTNRGVLWVLADRRPITVH